MMVFFVYSVNVNTLDLNVLGHGKQQNELIILFTKFTAQKQHVIMVNNLNVGVPEFARL